jgi:hypothetical protein
MYNVMDMSRKVRKQIYIDPEQEQLLKRRAEALGISEAEIIRRKLNEPERPGISKPRNPKAWQQELAFIKRRARKLPALNKQRTWTREELYEERLGRFSR